MTQLLDGAAVVARLLSHIDHKTTDRVGAGWREPVANYRDEGRFHAEMQLVLRRASTPFCPSAAIAARGSFVARVAAGVPLLVVRGADGRVRAFRNACRHRGAKLACGQGQAQAFTCPYHGWTYGLDGALRHVPHEDGFPGLEKATRGLAEVAVTEQRGLIFVTQDGNSAMEVGDGLPPDMFQPGMTLVSVSEQPVKANWKLMAESFLEGYHIRATHRTTFYPLQYDNLNVVEQFGLNSRIAFPYRNIEKLRVLPPETRSPDGVLTFVYHLFPNVMIATFPGRTLLVVLEPESVSATRIVTYVMVDAGLAADQRQAVADGLELVAQGAREDRETVESIQAALSSNANEYFEFGVFEGAIAHFHKNLNQYIGNLP